MNALQKLHEFGQSIWLDSISRKLLESGELARLVREDGVRGVTSNPSIFEKAIGEGTDYQGELARLRRDSPAASTFELYEQLALRDIRAAADILRPLYDQSKKRDGYVSLEVTLDAGDDERAILMEARHLWKQVARPNVMIKVPGTDAGIAAFEELIGEGVNVNVTLLFSQATYARVAAAYLAGLEAFAKKGGELASVASVASFFVSRIDSSADKLLEARLSTARSEADKQRLQSLLGKVAIANAKLAYAHYLDVLATPRWGKLAKQGAQSQRVLWASTGTKNKKYSDVLYIEELIGKDTVNTAPTATIDAFRSHGKPRASLTEGLDRAREVLKALGEVGISLDEITVALLVDGLEQFEAAFQKVLATIRDQAQTAAPLAAIEAKLPDDLQRAVTAALEDWRAGAKVDRLWRRDATLWSGTDEGNWLAWLDAPRAGLASVPSLVQFAAEIRAAGFTHVLLLGMGGSSLCPEVLQLTYGSKPGFPKLEVLDSTDPQQIANVEARVDLARTLCIVASKSGSTLEPSIFEQYFFARMVATVGRERAAAHFVAITDPGSKLEALAKQKGYRRVFAGVPSIGGRFSALSNFGLVPAALIGLDVEAFVRRADDMTNGCGPAHAVERNLAVPLGAIIGCAAKLGRDKLTLVLSPAVASLGAWLEQLVAESTGKNGQGVIPIDLEPLAAPTAYGHDRVFVYVRHARSADAAQDRAIDELERAGQPIVRIALADKLDLGAEFFRFEFATAVAGAILGINPFDQPDVEASKIATKALTAEVERTGSLPEEKPFFETQGITLYSDERNVSVLQQMSGSEPRLSHILRALLDLSQPGDYFALLAYVEMNAAHRAELQTMRRDVRDALQIATCVGFGPRFLHSTGQAYKGGPNSGLFLQITATDKADLEVPGAKYSFGTVKAAQARGDFQVLVERQRRALRAHITGDVRSGLVRLRESLTNALTQHARAHS